MATQLGSASVPLWPLSGSAMNRRKSMSSLKKTYAMRKEADPGRNDYSGKNIVDENLIVLRKRIYEMKMTERKYEAPVEWMDWEKSFYTSYNSLICEAMGVLQNQLMNTRPGLVLGMLALVTLTVPSSTVLAMLYLMELSSGMLHGIN